MDFARMFNNQDRTGQGTSSGVSFPFNLQLPRIDINSISDTISNSLNQSNIISQSLENIFCPSKEEKEMLCDGCGIKFNIFKRKKTCNQCKMIFCVSCIYKNYGNKCKKCILLTQVPLDRDALMTLRVKDLVWYLNTKKISINHCKEKSELVNLIVESSRSQHFSYNSANYSNDYSNNYPNNSQSSTNEIFEQQHFSQSPRNEESNSNQPSSHSHTPPDSSLNSDNDKNGKNQTNSQNPESGDFKPFNIEDITSQDQIQNLSVRQLKLLLTRNFVDYKGCCEKEELIEKVKRLWCSLQENKRQNSDDIPDSNACKVCMENEIDCVLLECGHMVVCSQCGKRMNECPICRQYVVRVIRIFKS